MNALLKSMRGDWRFALCNGVFALYALHYLLPFDPLVLGILANLLVFIVPGLGWLGVLRPRCGDVIAGVLVLNASSLGVLLAASLARWLVGGPVSSAFFFSFLVAVTNVGIAWFPRPPGGFGFPGGRTLAAGCLSAFLLYGALFLGADRIPSLADLDEEVPGTSYGLVAELRPTMTSNMGYWFYFAHPPLSNLYTAYSVLFMERLDDMAYYHSAASALDAVNRDGGERTFDYPGADGESIAMTVRRTAEGVVLRTREAGGKTGETAFADMPDAARRFSEWDRANFRRARLLPAVRASNIFLISLSFLALFLWTRSLTGSRVLPALVGLAFVLSPGSTVRSVSATHLAAANYTLLLFAYALVRSEERAADPGRSGWTALAGFMAAWAEQKTIVLVAAFVLCSAAASAWRRRSLPQAARDLFYRPVLGYVAGLAAFWTYGLLVSAWTFVHFHIASHIVHRVRHPGLDGGRGYPGVLDLWQGFVVEAPLVLLVAASIVTGWRKIRRAPVPLLLVWIGLGAVGYSLVDWKQTRHLCTLLPAMSLVPVYLAAPAGPGERNALPWAYAALLAYSAAFLVMLGVDFDFYRPWPPIW
jgi:hypothetical protein